eukprot:SAG31_NODE_24396_length_482_cov_1.044386_2_plen_42_part_01
MQLTPRAVLVTTDSLASDSPPASLDRETSAVIATPDEKASTI